ncbi:MAG: GTP 3',8-cyclase MoaA [Pseudomonadota bacterium]
MDNRSRSSTASHRPGADPGRPLLVDRFGRQISYLRLSVTDRCDLRCTYCMAEKMVFLPRKDLLTLEELERLCTVFIDRGVRKIRLTGGEPLVRRGILDLFDQLGGRLGHGLDELTLTTNATQLASSADRLARAGVKRVNISLDSLDPETFKRVTRRAELPRVLDGIDAALEAGLKVKINTVALKQDNADEIPDMVAWAHSKGMDLTLIEVMPLGETGEDRFDQYIPLPMIRDALDTRFTLEDLPQTDRLGGPSRYARIAETGRRVGFITPLTNNFCAGCNRVRVTCTGRIYMCLGQDDHVDLRAALRDTPGDDAALHESLDRALGAKPEKHDFRIDRRGAKPALDRHMSTTGG